MNDAKSLEDAANAIANSLNADVFLFNGPITPGADREFIEKCRKATKRENVLLVLVTPGGDAHTAYKIARCLQRCWKHVTVFVPGWCKSAGTLIAIGAHSLIIGDLGELGPIDVQRAKPDELWEMNSGLIEEAAFKALDSAALSMFADALMHIKGISEGQVTFKTASDIASKMVIGQLQPVYAQIDPVKIGENSRGMQVASHYGRRLAMHSRSIGERAKLESLVSSYASHAFVIDREEAKTIFTSVTAPNAECEALAEALGDEAYLPIEGVVPIQKFLSRMNRHETVPSNDDSADAPSADNDGGYTRGADGGASANSATKVAELRPSRDNGEFPEGETEVA